MNKFLAIALVFSCCLFSGSALCIEDMPEPGMAPDYEPEDVGAVSSDIVAEEDLIKDTVPVNAPEIEENNDLVNDAAEENNDYNEFEGRIDSIQADEKAITGNDME